MNIGITAMPTDGVEVKDLGTGFALVSLYKNEVTTTNDDSTTSITADKQELTLRYSDDLLAEVVANFDYYYSKAENDAYQSSLDALNATYAEAKKELREAHSSILLSSALTDDQRTAAIAKLKTKYATLTTELLAEQEAL